MYSMARLNKTGAKLMQKYGEGCGQIEMFIIIIIFINANDRGPWSNRCNWIRYPRSYAKLGSVSERKCLLQTSHFTQLVTATATFHLTVVPCSHTQ